MHGGRVRGEAAARGGGGCRRFSKAGGGRGLLHMQTDQDGDHPELSQP
jgi:hypothetical protein